MAMKWAWLRSSLRVTSIRGVPVFAHWSVPAIALFVLGASIGHEAAAVAGVLAYLAMLTIHELGHQLVAQWRGYHVIRIERYPVYALCRFERPEYAMDMAAKRRGRR